MKLPTIRVSVPAVFRAARWVWRSAKAEPPADGRLADALAALRMADHYAVDVKLSPVLCRALLAELMRDNPNQEETK